MTQDWDVIAYCSKCQGMRNAVVELSNPGSSLPPIVRLPLVIPFFNHEHITRKLNPIGRGHHGSQ